MTRIHLDNGQEEAKCGAKSRSRWSFTPTTTDEAQVTCRNCKGVRRVSDYPRETRGTEIKQLIKKEFPKAKVSVRIEKYSMGESINIKTDLIKWVKVEDGSNYTGFSMKKTEESRENENILNDLLGKYESIDRDQWGEILSGGNTYLFIDGIDR